MWAVRWGVLFAGVSLAYCPQAYSAYQYTEGGYADRQYSEYNEEEHTMPMQPANQAIFDSMARIRRYPTNPTRTPDTMTIDDNVDKTTNEFTSTSYFVHPTRILNPAAREQIRAALKDILAGRITPATPTRSDSDNIQPTRTPERERLSKLRQAIKEILAGRNIDPAVATWTEADITTENSFTDIYDYLIDHQARDGYVDRNTEQGLRWATRVEDTNVLTMKSDIAPAYSQDDTQEDYNYIVPRAKPTTTEPKDGRTKSQLTDRPDSPGHSKTTRPDYPDTTTPIRGPTPSPTQETTRPTRSPSSLPPQETTTSTRFSTSTLSEKNLGSTSSSASTHSEKGSGSTSSSASTHSTKSSGSTSSSASTHSTKSSGSTGSSTSSSTGSSTSSSTGSSSSSSSSTSSTPSTSTSSSTSSSTASRTTTSSEATTSEGSTKKTTKTYDLEEVMKIFENITYDYIMGNLTSLFNKTLYKDMPTCPTPTTTPTTTTTTMPPFPIETTPVIAKCFVCGLDDTQIPRNSFCADAFAGDFIPLVPIDPSAKGHISRFRKYCRHMNVSNYITDRREPRSIFGRWTGGCSVRWTDLSGIYTQRACRSKKRATMGRHFASHRMASLEMALSNVDNGCIISPSASLLPLSRGISLFARFHACVCKGSWCNRAPNNRHWIPNYLFLTIWLLCKII